MNDTNWCESKKRKVRSYFGYTEYSLTLSLSSILPWFSFINPICGSRPHSIFFLFILAFFLNIAKIFILTSSLYPFQIRTFSFFSYSMLCFLSIHFCNSIYSFHTCVIVSSALLIQPSFTLFLELFSCRFLSFIQFVCVCVIFIVCLFVLTVLLLLLGNIKPLIPVFVTTQWI